MQSRRGEILMLVITMTIIAVNRLLIGFDFWYDGKRYTQFSVSTNGFIDLDSSSWNGGSGLVQPNNPYGPYSTDFVNPTRSALSGGIGTVTALAPLYYDLTTFHTTVPLGNSIMYLVSGTAPNRILTVEWNNMSAWTNQADTLNFQVKLYESTGVIEYNYGYMSGTISTAYGFGYVTGINAPSISPNPPTASQLLCLQTANTNTFSNGQQNQLAAMPQSYSKYTFTPQIPGNPSTLTFTSVAPNSMTLNWVDNANNEIGYAIYSSLDGSNYIYTTQVAANSTSYTATGLSPATPYYWKVYAVTEGGLSASLGGSQATTVAANFTSAQTGNWNSAATWGVSGIPTVNANVTIANGNTVTIDGDITVNNITVSAGGTLLIGNDNTDRTLNVLGNITVNASAQFTVNSGSVTSGHILNLSGNIVNNGTFDLGPNTVSRCQAMFNKSGTQTMSGTGAVTRFYLMTLNMGSTNNNVLDITPSNFSTQSTGFLTIINGTFKYGASSTITPFTASYIIPLTGGLWVYNSSAAVVTTTGGNLSVRGFIRVTNGVLNVGTAADQQLLSSGGTFIIEGGAVNVAGSFSSASFATMSFTISGGTVTVPTVGSTPAGQAPFMLSIAGSTFNQTGGTIVIRNPGNGNLGYVNTNTASSSVLGGALQIGDYGTLTAQTIQINSTIPVYNLTDSSANATVFLTANNLTVKNNVLVAAGTLNANNLNINVQGNWTNQGTFIPGTGTVAFIGSAGSLITNASGETFNNLTLNKLSSDVNLGSAVTVNGILNFASAHLLLGNNNLTLNGSVSGAADGKCIVTNGTGVVSKIIAPAGSFTFPLGISTRYNPVAFTSPLGGTYSAAIDSGETPATANNAASCLRTWILTGTNPAANVTFTWNSTDAGASFSPSSCDAWYFNGTTWIDMAGATAGSGPTYTTTLTNVTSFSKWTIGNSGSLPVEMISFTATVKSTGAMLKWGTATEVNNYGFNIERRAMTSSAWAQIGFVAGNGTSNATHSYSYADNNLSAGTYAYRIKQIDNDGICKYSASIEVTVAGVPKEFKLYGNYPNPFNPSTTIMFTVPEDGHATLKVYNIVGQPVATLIEGEVKTEQCTTKRYLMHHDCPAASILSILEFGNQRLVKKMILTK